MPASVFDRAWAREALAERTFDLLVIGGGITGAGVALDAAARGLRTALVERGDFASGTSSRSSRLVHGGLRYLHQRELGLVGQSLAERQRLLHNAPHLVEPLALVIPLFAREGAGGRWALDAAVVRAHSSALWVYDLCGGARIGHFHHRVDGREILAHLPTLRPDRLVGGFVYHDAQTDDARLTLALARTAVLDHQAVAANYASVVALARDGSGRVNGARVAAPARPGGPGTEEVEVRASVVVNATGVWSDEVMALDDDSHRPMIRPARGAHVTLSRQALPCDRAAVLPVAGDGRTIFMVPWGDHVYVGTTDTDYQGPHDDPRCGPEDVSYLLDAVNAVVTRPVSRTDVTGVWAGLRPLVVEPGSQRRSAGRPGQAAAPSRTADLSRRHQVMVSPAGLVTVTGGKLTTYRKMAADTVDEVMASLARVGGGARPGSLRRGPSPTRRLRLRGAEGSEELRGAAAAGRLGADPAALGRLVARYGSEAVEVLALAQTHPDLARPLVPGLAYVGAEAVWAVRHEMAHTLDDVLSRRTRVAACDDRAAAAAASKVGQLMAAELGWSASHREGQVAAFVKRLGAERAAAGLPPLEANGTARPVGPDTWPATEPGR